MFAGLGTRFAGYKLVFDREKRDDPAIYTDVLQIGRSQEMGKVTLSLC